MGNKRYIYPKANIWESNGEWFEDKEESVTEAILYNYAPKGVIGKKGAEQACAGILFGTRALT